MTVRAGRTTIELICAVCGNKYLKELSEHKRNQRLGRTSVCGRVCHAVLMNYSPAKQKQTKAMLKKRNAHQYRDDNPNWKGGVSAGSGHPLKKIPSSYKRVNPQKE